MEKLIRLMANGKTASEQTRLVEEMREITEFVGVALACLIVMAAVAIA